MHSNNFKHSNVFLRCEYLSRNISVSTNFNINTVLLNEDDNFYNKFLENR